MKQLRFRPYIGATRRRSQPATVHHIAYRLSDETEKCLVQALDQLDMHTQKAYDQIEHACQVYAVSENRRFFLQTRLCWYS